MMEDVLYFPISTNVKQRNYYFFYLGKKGHFFFNFYKLNISFDS